MCVYLEAVAVALVQRPADVLVKSLDGNPRVSAHAVDDAVHRLGLLEALALLRFLFRRNAFLAQVDVSRLVVDADDRDDLHAPDSHQLADGPARD